MSTTITMPEARSAPPQQQPARGQNETAVAASGTADVREPGLEGKKPGTPGSRKLMIPLAIVAVLSGLTAAGVGFALSYGALRDAAVGWGFGSGWESYAFPLGVDGLIIALYTADLVMAWRRMARPWVRVCAHALTAVTIALNVSAAAGGMPRSPGLLEAVQADPGRLLGHAMMPVAYVILTEVARWAIVRTARLEAGHLDDEALTLADWLLNFRVTWKIFQHAKTYPAPYAEARQFVRQLAIYRVWQKHRARYAEGSTQDRASVLDRMPALLAPYGVSVEEARAIPARMLTQEKAQEASRRQAERQEAEDREQQQRDDEKAEQTRKREREQREKAERRERERQEREDAHQARMDTLAKEADQARQEAEVAKLKALADGEVRAAAHQAEATAATAGIQAQAAQSTAERAALDAARRAEAEHQAEENARTAELRRKAAEDLQAQAAAEAETQRLAAEAARQERQAAEDQRTTAMALKEEAAARAEAARLDHEAARIEQEAAQVRDQATQKAYTGATAAELDRKAAQDRQAQAAADAETQRLAAEAARQERQAAEDKQAAGRALHADAQARAEAARLDHEAAQLRTEIARAERQAAEDEDNARLQPRERAVRKVARMVLTSQTGKVALYDIEQAMGVKESTASDYLKEARALISTGYTLPHTNSQEHTTA
ncbi:DUF2637 domain-containing protein [Streptomyces fulvorobeus]|uniref:DUF2637 domain-containing protein n=1 Tax=Streptomyces fulvorobeus TaxID=284028 RepID=A0A7J0CG03_9ACTN|nr:DUF2637 domain-containing protein [Streptomyces fulvorobeus]NYE44853.1 hypothetical protein [Streptomyces fulvorobeus]GFN01430.1 hypothetical protein Sfulv_62400 [Streptomyces fulvorobeus]